MSQKFHLSLPCHSITQTKQFYLSLGASQGRRAQNWIDINFYEHQITFTKSGKFSFDSKNYSFGGHILPSFHFGIILSPEEWMAKLNEINKKKIKIEDQIRFLNGKIGEHQSFFLKDPNGYIIEFKGFVNSDEVFKSE